MPGIDETRGNQFQSGNHSGTQNPIHDLESEVVDEFAVFSKVVFPGCHSRPHFWRIPERHGFIKSEIDLSKAFLEYSLLPELSRIADSFCFIAAGKFSKVRIFLGNLIISMKAGTKIRSFNSAFLYGL